MFNQPADSVCSQQNECYQISALLNSYDHVADRDRHDGVNRHASYRERRKERYLQNWTECMILEKEVKTDRDREKVSQTDTEKMLSHVTCTSAAVLPKRASIFRVGMYTEASWKETITTNSSQHVPTKRRPPLDHTVTQHQHERKEEKSTGKCQDIIFSAELLPRKQSGTPRKHIKRDEEKVRVVFQ